MKEIVCKLLVIGAGPAGYVCAIRAGQLGLDTVIVEADKPGGTCLNVGCIPSKALIHAAEEFGATKQMLTGGNAMGIRIEGATIDLAKTIAWKDGIVGRLNSGVSALLQKARVKIVHGRAAFRDGKTVEVETETGMQVIRAETVVIATGSKPVELSALPFGGRVISSTEALSLGEVPKRLVVVGGGYIGLELGTAFAKLGSEVTVVEAMQQVLPQYDADLARPVARRLSELGIHVLTGAKARSLSTTAMHWSSRHRADSNNCCLPTGCLSRSVGGRDRQAQVSKSSTSIAAGRTFASMIAAAPPCGVSMRSATSPANRCWPIVPWHREKWSPRSLPAGSAPGTSAAFRRSALPIRKS